MGSDLRVGKPTPNAAPSPPFLRSGLPETQSFISYKLSILLNSRPGIIYPWARDANQKAVPMFKSMWVSRGFEKVYKI